MKKLLVIVVLVLLAVGCKSPTATIPDYDNSNIEPAIVELVPDVHPYVNDKEIQVNISNARVESIKHNRAKVIWQTDHKSTAVITVI
jgi:uncharacterized protein YcfL